MGKTIKIEPKKEFSIIPEGFDPNTKIWRYLDFPEFLAMSHNNNLYFNRIERYEDLEEGAISEADTKKLIGQGVPKEHIDWLNLYVQKNIFVSPWTIRNDENHLMWKEYTEGKYGIAILSSLKRLENSIKNFKLKYNIIAKEFSYGKEMNWAELKEPKELFKYMIFNKNVEFCDDKELRVVINKLPLLELIETTMININLQDRINKLQQQKVDDAISIKINLKTLVCKIIICPKAPDWFYILVKNVIQKYGLDLSVEKSSIKYKDKKP